MKIAVIVLAVIALGAAGLAWQQHRALAGAQAELAMAKSDLQKAQAEARAKDAAAETARKEAAAHKAALDQQQAEFRATQSFLETERALSARLRDELERAKEMIASGGRPRGGQPQASQSAPPGYVPMLVRPQPTTIRAAPSAGAAQGNAVRAE